LLLLEDVFEHLGEDDNRKIMDFVTNPENKWTLVAVSNDPYLAQKCNRVIIMEQGQVIHDGDYDSLKTVAKFNTNGHA
jgi:ABC-type transport system involved in cytochrome bd biosynthesis fused ATPase/permease subunit